MRLLRTFTLFGCTLGLVAGCTAGSSSDTSSGGNGPGSGGSNASGANSGGGGDSGASTSDSTTQGTSSANGGAGGGSQDCATPCDPGTICEAGQCVPGCALPEAPCPGTLACCDGACLEVDSDVNNCGACGNACADIPNAAESCSGGQCLIASCEEGFANCDGDATNGCEVSGTCACTPGATQPCYEGPMGTADVGACKSGEQTCKPDGTGWGFCVNQLFPIDEVCGNGIDDDCDNLIDEDMDADGDGFGRCSGDCCDDPTQGCADPKLVNPGAFEVAGNQVDDDCDGTDDNPVNNCDGMLASNSGNALDYGKAIDLCKTTTENGTGWGLISGSFSRANGAGNPATTARSIRTGFGSGVTPLMGGQLAVLSTGNAAAQAAPNNTNPAYSNFQTSVVHGTNSAPPSDWLMANNNNLPNAAGCPEPQNGATNAYDTIALKLRVRVPTNANSFSVKTFFYSSEYPEWVCSPYNDFFLALLNSNYSGNPANPADRNLAIYTTPNNSKYPVGVNLAFGNTGLFTQCVNGPTGCGTGSVAGTTNTCMNTTLLAGTGFDLANPSSPFPGDPGYCGVNNLLGGGTGWLTTSGNVVPGETIELRFVVWDTGDGYYDSVVLLDNFVWSVTASQPGTKG